METESINIKLPIKIISEANNTDHWTKKHKRKKDIAKKLRTYLPSFGKCHLPCKVTLTRISPRRLDSDNLIISFKFIRDYLSNLLIPGLAPGRADDDHRIEWCYEQVRGESKEYAIIVRIESKLTE